MLSFLFLAVFMAGNGGLTAESTWSEAVGGNEAQLGTMVVHDICLMCWDRRQSDNVVGMPPP